MGVKECETCLKLKLYFQTLFCPLVCENLNKLFSRQKHEDTNICGFCGRRFVKRKYLQTHQKLHEGKTYKCNSWAKEFRTKRYLNRHLKKCKNYRSSHGLLACVICNKQFSNSQKLNQHEKTHEIKFKCNNCDTNPAAKPESQRHEEMEKG